MIKIKNLYKTYQSKKGNKVQALENINIQLPDFGLIFIVGKSGCGKTTLLNLLGGLDKPDCGTIIVNNCEITNLSINELSGYRNTDIGFVFQDYFLIEYLTARENVMLALELQNQKNYSSVDKLFERLDINGQECKFIGELSGGQKQRVAIARALIKEPRVIFADEPTGALDLNTGREIIKTLKKISKEKLVIIVSHDIDYANEFADRIIELSDGKIINDYSNNVIDEGNKIVQNMSMAIGNKKTRSKLKLSFSFVSRLGMKGILKRKGKFITSIIISLIGLLLLGTILSYSNFKQEKLFLDTMYESHKNYIPIISPPYVGGELNTLDINSLENKFSNHNFISVYNAFDNKNNNFSALISNYSSMIYYYFDSFSGFMEIDKNIASDFSFELLAGDFPSNDNEVIIADYFYTYFKDLGYKDYYTQLSYEITSYNELIGKKIGTAEMFGFCGGFTICGIIDTGFDSEKYDILKTKNSDDGVVVGNLDRYYSDLIQYGVERILYVAPGFHERITMNYDNRSLDELLVMAVVSLTKNEVIDINLLKHLRNELGSEGDRRYYYVNDIISQLRDLEEILFYLTNIFYITGLVMISFSFILLYNYFSSTITDDKKSFHILRLLGATGKDVFKINYIRALLIVAVLVIFSFSIVFIIVATINSYLNTYFFLNFKLFSFGFIQGMTIIALCLLTTTLASAISLCQYMKRSPLVQINDF